MTYDRSAKTWFPRRARDALVQNVIDKYTCELAYDAKDANVVSGVWVPTVGAGTLSDPGWTSAPTPGQSTSGLVEAAIGASRVDTALLHDDTDGETVGFVSAGGAGDVAFSEESEFWVRVIVDVQGSVAGANGALFQYLISGTRYFDVVYTAESGADHVLSARLRYDNLGGSPGGITESVSIPIDNGWTVLDLIARNVGGVSRLDHYINGVEHLGTPHDFLLTAGHDFYSGAFGVGTNRQGTGAFPWPFLRWQRSLGDLSLADHQTDVSTLGIS